MTHAHEPRVCTMADLFTINGDEADVETLLQEGDAYLAIFAAPTRVDGDEVCFHCGERFSGLLANLGFGAGIEWGLVHGEGHCSKCRWPYRGMHYPKDAEGKELFSMRNLFLAYLPDQLQ